MEIGDVSEEAKAILTFNDILRKYRRRFSIDGIYNSYSALVDIVLKGIKENSESLLHMDIKELNRIINRTQAAKKDSFADYMRNAIKEGESFPREMDDIVVLVSRGVDHIIGQKKEIAKMRSSANEDEKCAIEFLPGINTEISVDDIRAISFSHRIGNRNCTIEESGAKPTRTNKEVISVSPTGFSYSYSEDDSKPVVKKEIKYYTPVSVQPFEELPPVHFNANISLDDDNSIFEAAAFSAESSATLLGSINKGNNTRNMTTRTAISKLGILETLYALMNRDDKSRKANLLVSNSNQEVNSFYRMLIKDYEHVFKKHNIEVHAISANTLNNIADPLVKKREGVHIVGNSLSFDVGVKMDYVQEGTYRGVLTNISATVQSFARQIGKAQDVSRFNIYNNGYAKKISCPSKTGVTVNDNIEQNIIDGIAVDSTEATKEALRKRFTGASSPVWQEIGKVLDGYTVKLNKQTEKNFRGFEVFVTGMPIVEDLSKYEGVERTKKIAEITSMRTSKVYLGDKIEGEKPLTGISKNENTEEVASLAPSKIAL
ncbi:MAG TPA: hypothetical protein ENO12_00510 [Thermoplasmatales archaeon]|nr:hypothetical protein [Thermoplasmatales archaeon]